MGRLWQSITSTFFRRQVPRAERKRGEVIFKQSGTGGQVLCLFMESERPTAPVAARQYTSLKSVGQCFARPRKHTAVSIMLSILDRLEGIKKKISIAVATEELGAE